MSRRSSVAPALVLGAMLVSLPAAAQTPRLLGQSVEPTAAPAAPVPAGEAVASGPTFSAASVAPEPAPVQRLFGISGKLRAMIVEPLEALDLPFLAGFAGTESSALHWSPLFGSGNRRVLGEPTASTAHVSPETPGIWRLQADQAYLSSSGAGSVVELITRVPFVKKHGTHLNGYHIGRYPAEGSGRTDQYAPPPGFIEVTRENQDFRVSEHFRLKQFLTKDQFNVWPKYLALDLQLIDKLELVLQELNAMGVRADRMHVMSGFRTPQYNGPGGNGRAKLSRHTYGDAADVWVDNDGNGYMDDLNGDGQADLHDAAVILKAVDRVEARYPELVGGAGLYVANSAHGPFIHIDTRGSRSRW